MRAPVGHLLNDDLTPDWVDAVAVRRCLNGLDVGRPLHHAERLVVAATAHERGDSNAEIGRLLDVVGETARKYIKEATQ